MEKNEVICISSDDDEKINDKQKSLSSDEKVNEFNSVNTSRELLYNNEKKDIAKQKRKISEVDDTSNVKNNSIDKKMKTKLSQEVNGQLVEDSDKQNDIKSQICTSTPVNSGIVKPKLIIKEKKNISILEPDIFPMFISLCLQKKREPAMEIIVNKLKRRYELMNPIYAKSEVFQNFLNRKRNAILSSDNMIYHHIMDVKTEMKARAKGALKTVQSKTNKSNVSSDMSSSKASSSPSIFNNTEMMDIDEEDYEDNTMDPHIEKRLKKIVKVMNICEKRIKMLEEAEVDFDDEDNSNYIKLEKYKERMVNLYNEYCRITGDNADAGRPYLRPKHLNPTQIVIVDQAITNFINAKITKRNKLKRNGRFTDDLIFPDYTDILKCVSDCNEKNNLGLDKKKQSQIAKKAFTNLGEHLQRARRNDYWDTFSLCLENKQEDPALIDQDLAQKLRTNREIGEQKLTQVFQDYVRKQEEMNNSSLKNKTNIENDDNEDHNIESKDEDEHSEEDNEDYEDDSDIVEGEDENDIVESEDENHIIESEDKDDKDKDDKDKGDKDKDDTDKGDKDKGDKDEVVIDSSEQNIKKNEHHILENEISLENDLTNTCEDKDSKDVLITNIKEVRCDIKHLKLDSALFEKTNESGSAIQSDVSVIQESSTLNNNDTKDESDEIMLLDNDCDETTGGNKPLLRVRSFAKHPTTWEDNKQKFQNAGNGATKEVIDLTNDVAITKVEVPNFKIQAAILPSKNKYKTVLIPANLANKSIINVKNITNNYLKVNPRDISSNKSSNVKSLSVVQQVVDVSSVNTIIHLPHSSDQQNTNNNENNNETKQNKTIVHLLVPAEQVHNNNSLGMSIIESSINKPK
uniref:protein PFC0760c-like isoform X2 n=1 Tax=Vespula vulgaris TaxID=7454 RepID=UPI002144247D|nr:protein PFC0760c-like isoform X2 [Vespula vulgaris]